MSISNNLIIFCQLQDTPPKKKRDGKRKMDDRQEKPKSCRRLFDNDRNLDDELDDSLIMNEDVSIFFF